MAQVSIFLPVGVYLFFVKCNGQSNRSDADQYENMIIVPMTAMFSEFILFPIQYLTELLFTSALMK